MDWYLQFFELLNYSDNQYIVSFLRKEKDIVCCVFFKRRTEKVPTLQRHLERNYLAHIVPAPLLRLDMLNMTTECFETW